ncbi:aminoglycoside phosphotransferase family protein [Lachnospiraceae bacterium 47-T17]
MKSISEEQIVNVAEQFCFEGIYQGSEPFGNGHINDTFRLVFQTGKQEIKRYILQRMNKDIFSKPAQLMENIAGVTTYLRDVITANGGDPKRETLNVIPAKDGATYYSDAQEEYWRAFSFIEDADSLEQVKTPEDFYECAVAFGNFQRQLADYPAETLHETIPGFHDTKARFEVFQEAVKKDICRRAASVQKEIDFILEREQITGVFGDLLAKKEIPLRVTHNDTKLNNIMIDKKTRKGICVIDLDTVMPGLAMNDFGDSIRFGASSALEDERDLSKVRCDMDLFEAYTRGFIEGCGGKLTRREIELLPMGAKVMTFECGMRFLTDYLQGDIYFKIHRPAQNLDRCRTQLKLVWDMEQKWQTMQEIVKKYDC